MKGFLIALGWIVAIALVLVGGNMLHQHQSAAQASGRVTAHH
ncbi:MAG: hypothetical protein ACE5FN_03045 [Leptospirillia bacterium]